MKTTPDRITPVTTVSPAFVGFDIGKASLDVSLAGQPPGRYANAAAGRSALITALKKLPQPVQVICEPSGGYERDLLAALWAAGLAVSLVPAARVRAFARAQGRLAKTDPIDAGVLRHFGEVFTPAPLAAPAAERARLAALVQRPNNWSTSSRRKSRVSPRPANPWWANSVSACARPCKYKSNSSTN